MIEALTELGFAVDEDMLARRTAAGPVDRPPPSRPGGGQPAGEPRTAGGRRPAGPDRLPGGVPDRGPAGVRAPVRADRAGGDRADPRRRRRGGVGASVLGHRRARRRCSTPSTASARAGLDGVEAFYVTHTEEQTRLLAERAAELGLLTTGSSDFHGPEHHTFSRFRAFSHLRAGARARAARRLRAAAIVAGRPRRPSPGERSRRVSPSSASGRSRRCAWARSARARAGPP